MAVADMEQAIRTRNVQAILNSMFSSNGKEIRDGFKNESHLWDYKENIPKPEKSREKAWAKIASHVLAFYNRGGGILVFGVDDKTYKVTKTKHHVDSKLFNDQVRKFLSDRIYIEYHRSFIEENQCYVGIAIIPQRGPNIEKFIHDSPKEHDGSQLFRKGMSAIREHDSSKILTAEQTTQYIKTIRLPTLGKIYELDCQYYRVLCPDYEKFVHRDILCNKTIEGLYDKRTSVTSLIGIGGVGKTALATWAVLDAYKKNIFEFIVSITAKDRELTSSGIVGIPSSLSSFDNLLDNILEVLGENKFKSDDISKKEKIVRDLIENSNGLLFVDNLETVDDIRIIGFLNTLPVGVKAITTSRITRIRFSAYPIEVGPMSFLEMHNYIKTLSYKTSLGYLSNISENTSEKLCRNCDGIPLALRWLASRSETQDELVSQTEGIKNSGKQGEELLEFSYRRVFDMLSSPEKSILSILSIFNKPIPEEVILVGSGFERLVIQDCIEKLVEDAMVQRFFDSDRNDYVYSLLPIIRTFIYSELCTHKGEEKRIRIKLKDYFEANDIADPDEKSVVIALRQGISQAEAPYIDLGITARKAGNFTNAKDLFLNALNRNPKSWRAAQQLGELYRHELGQPTKAMQYYEQAKSYAPSRGNDRMVIHREYGLVLRDSGEIGACDRAIECFIEALKESPDDSITLNALCRLYESRGHTGKIISLLEPKKDKIYGKAAAFLFPILIAAYKKRGEQLKALELQSRLNNC